VRQLDRASVGVVEHGPSVADLLGVPQRSVLVGEQDQLALPKGARRRESCNSISARRPCTLGSSGMSSARARLGVERGQSVALVDRGSDH
jgi:hypothetical protein